MAAGRMLAGDPVFCVLFYSDLVGSFILTLSDLLFNLFGSSPKPYKILKSCSGLEKSNPDFGESRLDLYTLDLDFQLYKASERFLFLFNEFC